MSVHQPEWARELPGLQAARTRQSKKRTAPCKQRKASASPGERERGKGLRDKGTKKRRPKKAPWRPER